MFVLTKRNGRKAGTPFIFTEDEVQSIARRSPGECFVFTNTTTRRALKLCAPGYVAKRRRR